MIDESIIKDYKSGQSLSALELKYKINRKRITKIIKDKNIPIRWANTYRIPHGLVTINCKNCKKEFTKAYNKRGRMFCSILCKRQFLKPTEYPCEVCGHLEVRYPSRLKNHYVVCSGRCRGVLTQSMLHNCSISDWIYKQKEVRKALAKERRGGVYRRLRIECFQKYDYKCFVCSSKDRLNMHHVRSVLEHPELITEPENLMAICYTCHKKLHKTNGNKTL